MTMEPELACVTTELAQTFALFRWHLPPGPEMLQHAGATIPAPMSMGVVPRCRAKGPTYPSRRDAAMERRYTAEEKHSVQVQRNGRAMSE